MRLASLVLEPLSPFRLDLTVWTLRRRPDNVVDRWDGQTYRRVLPLPVGFADISVTQSGPPEAPRLRVAVGNAARCPEVQQDVTTTLERLLGLRIDIAAFYPVFESVITAIASQQVTRTVGVLLLNRLAVRYGAAVHEGDVAVYAFPRAEDLAMLPPAQLRQLGFSLQKGRAIIELANSITTEGLDLEGLAEFPDEEVIEYLCDLRGVGRWSAEYVLLRGLGRTHVFPGDDVGARKNLERWLNLGSRLITRQFTALWSVGARMAD
ncbi:MAG: DNA-3-methyladenine glycosylase 2 [Bryobacteraceae bacterium]